MTQAVTRIRLLLALAISIVVLPPSSPSRIAAQARDVVDDPEAHAVYAAVLPMTFDSGVKDRSRVALFQETRSLSPCAGEERAGAEWRAVWDSYKKENNRVRTLLPNMDLGLPYDLVGLAEVQSLLVQAGHDGLTIRGGWSDAYTSFPNGRLLAFSAVGFDEFKTRALVAVQYDCGLSWDPRSLEHDCHSGSYISLVKQDGRWVRARVGVVSCGFIT